MPFLGGNLIKIALYLFDNYPYKETIRALVNGDISGLAQIKHETLKFKLSYKYIVRIKGLGLQTGCVEE